MSKFRRGFWLYPLFQIPLIFLTTFLTAALLFWLLGFGRPPVAVAIALDLSHSTYQPQEFNASGTIMNLEIKAVEAYVEKNASERIGKPNQIKILGFASNVIALTPSFEENKETIENELLNTMNNPNLVNIIGGGSELNLAIQEGIEALTTITNRCRELLIVTDGAVSVDPRVIKDAIQSQVKINAIVIGVNAPEVQAAVDQTGGIYLSGNENNLAILFTGKLFNNFNSNWRWIVFWLGLAWIALMWTLIMPLDRYLLQGLLKMPMNLAGRLALGNALFWTAATPGILWKIYQIFNLSLPFLSSC